MLGRVAGAKLEKNIADCRSSFFILMFWLRDRALQETETEDVAEGAAATTEGMAMV